MDSMVLMVSYLLAAVFVIVVAAAGYGLGAVVLAWRDRLALTGMTFIGGSVFLVMLTNALGYLLPISQAIYVSFAIVAALGILGIIRLCRTTHFADDIPPLGTMVVLLICAALAGLLGARFLGSDHMLWTHFPLPATILHGNFPVMEPMNPWQIVGYHYFPALFVAIYSSFTGLSLAAAYSWQPFIGAGALLFFAAALARRFGVSWKAVIIIAVLAYAGAGFTWFKGVFLLQDLWQHFVTGPALDVPFRNLTPMLSGISVFHYLGHRPTTLGTPLLFATLYCIADMWASDWHARKWRIAGVLLVFMLALALITETTYAVLGFSGVLYAIAAFVRKDKTIAPSMSSLIWVLVVMAVSLVIARFQGGLLTAFPQGDHPSFALAFDGRMYTYGSVRYITLWEFAFWREFGLPLILFPFALAYVWRKWRTQPLMLLLAIVATVHFLVPFVVRYLPRPGDMNHLFHAATALSSFLIGLWICSEVVPRSRKHALIGYFAMGLMLVSAFMYLVVRMVIPNFRLQSEPLFVKMLATTAEQNAMYEWVRMNTTQADRFYMGTLIDIQEYMPDELHQQRERVAFMSNTGRFSIGLMTWDNTTEGTKNKLRSIEERCDEQAFIALDIRYLIIDTNKRLDWFRNHCDASKWTLKYGQDAAAPYIYERSFTR